MWHFFQSSTASVLTPSPPPPPHPFPSVYSLASSYFISDPVSLSLTYSLSLPTLSVGLIPSRACPAALYEGNLVLHNNRISVVISGCIIDIDFRSSYGEAVHGLMHTHHPPSVTWKEEVTGTKHDVRQQEPCTADSLQSFAFQISKKLVKN